MITFSSPDQRRHAPTKEMHRGGFVSPFESPDRIDQILAALEQQGVGPVESPQDCGLESILRVHDPAYVEFLQTVFARWNQDGGDEEIVPHVWPARTMREIKPQSVYGQVGFYSFDAGTTIGRDSWVGAKASADAAVAAAQFARANREPAFALCRPPGHHASVDLYGGYCFLNTAAIAAESFLAAGANRVAILDVDYHHGNGTQDIFYQRDDVLFISIHADPSIAYPYFSGYADEVGSGSGESFNLNLPLPDGTDWPSFADALTIASQRIASFSPEHLIISLGVDTFEGDPISTFRLKTTDFREMGRRISQLDPAAAVMMEGGYAVDHLGENVASFLLGLEQR